MLERVRGVFLAPRWNSSFEKLFGARTKKVTVGALLRMQSGLGDFDCGPWDDITSHAGPRENPRGGELVP